MLLRRLRISSIHVTHIDLKAEWLYLYGVVDRLQSLRERSDAFGCIVRPQTGLDPRYPKNPVEVIPKPRQAAKAVMEVAPDSVKTSTFWPLAKAFLFHQL